MIKQRPYPMGGGLCTLLGLIVLLAACGGDPAPTAAPTAEPGGGIEVPPAEDEAVIDQAEVVLLDGFPVEANVEVRGTLPDACMPITQAAQAPIDAQTIGLGIFVTRDETVACTGEPLPFEETYALDIDGLPAGTYTVDVNGTLATFTLEEDNVRPNPGAICPQPSGSIVAAINPEAGYCLLHPGEAVVSAPAPGLQRIAVPEGPTLTITVLGPTDALPTGEPAIIGGQDAVLSEEEGERRAVAIYEGTGYAIALAPVDAALWDLVTASFTFFPADPVPYDPDQSADVTNCPAARGSLQSAASAAVGVCLLVPQGYAIANPSPTLITLNGEGVTMTIERRSDDEARAVEEVAREDLRQVETGDTELVVAASTIGGEAAIVADNVPGQEGRLRQAYVISGGRLYVITITPVDFNAAPEASAAAERLWEVAVPSLTFIAP